MAQTGLRVELHLRNSGAQALSGTFRFINRSAGHHDREFLAAVARDRVEDPDSPAQRIGNRAQGLIADLVAPAVIDRFEMVDVDHHHRKALRLAGLHQAAQMSHQIALIVEAGERVR